jgi:3-hydroxyisobutyrate dehydrogenase-like beta-hydroxyacid dehydrogenase
MLAVIAESAVASPLIGYKREMILSGDYEAAFSVEQMVKDFDLILGAARDAHVPMLLAALIRQQYEEAHTAGYGGRDFFVLCQDKNLS